MPEPSESVTETTRPRAGEGSVGDSEPPGDATTVEEAPQDVSRDALAGSPWKRVDFGVAAAVTAATMLVAWVFRSEIISSDPWHYVMAAIQFPQHSWVPLGYTRYGMILPLAPLVLAFGHAPATFYLPAIIASGVLAGCVYLVGRRWWGHVAGIAAVVLLLSNWIVFTTLSRYYPDIPSMALVMAALAVAVAARGRMLANARWAGLLVIVAGFLLGWSFETRETALFAWPAVVAVLWVRGRVVRNALLTAAPVLLWAVVDVAIGALAYGDPLLKLHTFTRQDLSTTKNPADVAVMDQFVGLPRVDYLTMIPRLVLERHVPGGVWFLVLAAIAALAIFVRNAAVRVSAAGLLVSYLLFVGISGFFIPSHPAGRLDVERYWIQFVPWIALAVSGALAVLVRSVLVRAVPAAGRPRAQQLAVAAVALLVAVLPAVSVARAASAAPTLATNGGTPLAGVSAELSRLRLPEQATVYTDWQTARVLPIYQRPWFGGSKRWYAGVRSITGKRQPGAGDYALLVTATADATPCGFCTGALAPWRKRHPSLPSKWTKVYASANEGYVLYAVR
ncbi:glycosyltransferase family 39 protein [Terrabacter sp. NPDC080008]|uniref:glycosyltransferase family 39 protein n=1 Tax=Terrabacter sp. NPDC080008 TaxID=3155176 RepID=UPI00344D0805